MGMGGMSNEYKEEVENRVYGGIEHAWSIPYNYEQKAKEE